MYRTKNDKRTKKSIEKIIRSLSECLDRKHLSEINVAEIAKGAGVSRATFYRIFDTPVDVLTCLCDNIVEDLGKKYEKELPDNNEDFKLFVLSSLIEHADSLNALYKSGRMDIMQNAIRPKAELLLNGSRIGLSPAEMDYARASAGAVLMSVLHVWYEHKCKETVDDLLAIFNKVSALS